MAALTSSEEASGLIFEIRGMVLPPLKGHVIM